MVHWVDIKFHFEPQDDLETNIQARRWTKTASLGLGNKFYVGEKPEATVDKKLQGRWKDKPRQDTKGYARHYWLGMNPNGG